MANLNTLIKDIDKMTAKLSPKFKKLGIETIQDLIFYYPYRYDDYSNLLKIKDLQPEVLTTIRVKIELIDSRRSFRKKMLLTEALVADETGKLKIVWFNQRYVPKILYPADEVYLSGKPILTDHGIEFHNPNFEKIGKYDKQTIHTNRMVPIYSTTEKLSQKQIRFILKKILPCLTQIKEWLPANIIKSEKLFSLHQALHQIHFPASKQNLAKARQRLKFDELFLMQMRSGLSKKELLKLKTAKIEFKEKQTKKFVDNLPFQMTDSQKTSAWEIIQDIAKKQPMNRLLEGDVGSGKTITAALGILNTLLNKLQVAYMAPTEILAQQQFKVFCEMFKDYNFNIALLTRSQSTIFIGKTKKQKSVKKADLTKGLSAHSYPRRPAEGEKNQNVSARRLDEQKLEKVNFVIGTHALIQDKINFKNLALVIVDEQHRFGVQQRQALTKKARQNHSHALRMSSHPYSHGYSPHFLSMSATPIPRSLALTAYGDLDLSVIDEMPKDRKPIKTEVIAPDKRAEAYQFIKKEISQSRQVFVICPLIDPSDKLGAKAVKEEFEKLDKKIFPNIEIGLLHGRLKANEKEKIMQEFADNKIKILVSTVVVEVGIDMPNATVIMIESAERFGLAQLHQLRGRVGRAEHQSYCFLFTESDNEKVIKRLHAVVESKNGFELAEKDLDFRGPGEVYGIKQSGYLDFLKIAKLTDWPIIKASKPWVEKILDADPKLENHLLIKQKLTEFEMSIHFE